MCFPSVVFYFKKKCSEWQIFFRAFRVEVFLNASAKSSHSGGPLGRHQVLFSQNSMKFYQNWIGSFSAVSRNFWVFSSGSSRECFYFAVSQRKTPKFEPQTFVAALLRVDVRSTMNEWGGEWGGGRGRASRGDGWTNPNVKLDWVNDRLVFTAPTISRRWTY